MTKTRKKYILFLGVFMKKIITDACSAVGEIAYKLSEVIPIYPITPSSPMAEYCSVQNSKGKKNIFGEDVKMIEMQSEGGVAGTLHGALLARSYATTFTSSQGLLLMIPNMYKLAGEGLPAVIHVSARAVASHALSIFCDHSDVMAVRGTGFVMLCSSSVQNSHYLALASHTLAMKSSLPVLHFFDGFRTSHEYQKINTLEDDEIKSIIKDYFSDFKASYQDKQYGTAQNPDVFFQNREANQYKYDKVEKDLSEIFIQLNKLTNSHFDFFEYYGDKDAEDIIVAMGSSCETIEEYLNQNKDIKLGLIKVVLYRPFLQEKFLEKLPKSVKTITVLDRTKENGATAPLALDVINAIYKSGRQIKILSGRYGLGGKDFTPASADSIFKNARGKQKDNFTVGIIDDVNNSALSISNYHSHLDDLQIKIFGLGSDGSVSASKSTIKILGDNYNKFVQGYFEYDSKKSGSLTISHLRLSDNPIKSEYLVQEEDVISINNFSFVTRYDCLEGLKDSGTVLINSIFDKDEIGRVLPVKYVSKLKEKNAKLFVINGQKIASDCNLGAKINIIMQAALLKCTKLLSDEEIISDLEKDIKKLFSSKGSDVVEKNIKAMKIALNCLEEVDVASLEGKVYKEQVDYENEFYKQIMKKQKNLEGDKIPVSAFNSDGSTELDTSQYEKRGIAVRLPKWIKENCIQCGQCVLACPHSALKAMLTSGEFEDKDSFVKAIGLNDKLFKILLSPEDCTGCGVCAKTCPAIKKALVMEEAPDLLQEKIEEYEKDKNYRQETQSLFSPLTAKGLQFEKSLFKFSGACAGCGETPYIKILTMLNGSNLMIANATGCSSIYGGTFGSCPYGKDDEGKGVFWANSLFEDNAEFGLGLKLGSQYNLNKDKKIWIIGGDGWAYDIGFGGLDHILASGENINILILDNQTYSNTGGQQSKATPTGASVKFAENGKTLRKKNIGEIALTYKDVFVAQVALGGNINQTIKAIKEAQDYNGVSLVIAYAPCVNQGFDMSNMMEEMKKAVNCGFWPLYQYNPIDKKLTLFSNFNDENYFDFLKGERRFVSTIEKGNQSLLEKQIEYSKENYDFLKKLNDK